MVGLSCGNRKQQRPNIVFVISDDQSYPHASAYGTEFVNTPAFDRIANEGILFHSAFVSTPSCSPSRASVLTGQDFYRLKETSMNHTIWPESLTTYPDVLKTHGYAVGYTGKGWGPGNWEVAGRDYNPAGPSFNEKRLTPPGKYISTIDYAGNFEVFLDTKETDNPFCFWVGFYEPHREFDEGIGLALGKTLESIDVPNYLPDAPEVRTDLADYAYEIEYNDSQLGRLLVTLEARGELENTLVVVTSDNGMAFPRAKATLYDSGTRMPLAVRWGDRISPGRVVNELVSLIDFGPTFLEAAGIPRPSTMTGVSLLPILLSTESGQINLGRDKVVFGIERHFPGSRPDGAGYPMRGLRTKDYLYIRNLMPELSPAGDRPGPVWPESDPVGGFGDTDGGMTKTFMWDRRSEYPKLVEKAFGVRPAEELYHIGDDPHQLSNLAADPAFSSVKQRLSIILDDYLKDTEDPRATGRGDELDIVMKRYPVVGANKSR
jgi:uncharacterized sulfatase